MPAEPRPQPFLFSMLVHATVLGWVAWGPSAVDREGGKSLYQQVIAPHERKIVWYAFRDKLPEASPLQRHGISRPPRAKEMSASQTIVSRPAGAPRARQLIWQPAPRLKLAQELKSPNLLAFETPQVPAPPESPKPKPFTPPARRAAAAPSMLPAAPPIQPSPEVDRKPVWGQEMPPPPKPQPRPFTPPREVKRAAVPAPSLAPPPQVAAPVEANPNPLLSQNPALPPKPRARLFIPPRESGPGPITPPALPAAPQLQVARSVTPIAPRLPEAVGALPSRPSPRSFVLPPERPRAVGAAPVLGPAPSLSASASASHLSVAIVSLHPAEHLAAALPEGSRQAQFSAAPQKRATGGNGEPVESARIFVPDLMIRDGRKSGEPALIARAAPTAPENLRAAARTNLPVSPAQPAPPLATRVARAPDPRLEGRPIYTITVQMPNVSSYQGSWIIWFAEREKHPGLPADVRAPVPLRKVDPKYFPAAMQEGVEGRVRLAAVIRKDGHVDSVTLLKHLDDRLDRSAEEALLKWEFEPALRQGQAVDVDAVVEIPFNLAPRARR